MEIPLVNGKHEAAMVICCALLLFACASPHGTAPILPEPSMNSRPFLLEHILAREPFLPESTMGRTVPYLQYFLRPVPYLPEPMMGSTPPLGEHFLRRTPFMPDPSYARTPPLLVPVLGPTHLPE